MVGHRNLELLGERLKFLRGSGADGPVPRHDDRVFGVRDDLGGLLDLGAGGLRGRGRLHREWLLSLNIGTGNVFRKVDEADAGFFCEGLLEGLANHLRNDLRLPDLGAVLGYGSEETDQIEMLVALLVHPRRGRLARNGHDRRPVHVRVRYAGHQIGGAGTEGRQADARSTGQPPVHVGHEGRTLLVTRGDETNRAVEQDVHHVDVLLARDAEDVIDVLVFKAPDEKLGGVHGLRPFL